MPFDEILRRSVDSLVNDLSSAVQAEREDAAKRARDAAEATAAAALAQAQTAAEQRGLAAGREEGLTEGRRQGFNQGRQEGYEAGKRDGLKAGNDAGFENGKAEGYRAGKDDGFRAGKDEGFAAGKDEGYRAGKEQGYSAGRSENGTEGDAADRATGERLAEALRAIDRARSLSEILDTLASCAGREAPRAAVLLVRDSTLVGWRFVGFGAALEQGTAFETPLTESGIIGEAVRSEAAVGGESSSASPPPPFAEASADCERVAIPIAVGGEVIAALYADRGAADRDARPARFAWRSALEMLASHAARALEAVTAFRTAQLMTEAAPKPQGSPASSEGEHAARRYARLLVSEIKLYHGAEVAAGRRERDLGRRLGGEITRARALYDQRASSHGPGTADYFEEELVRTLADGDAGLL
jgi:flagellar biosynthesis/type III secretory pathway protein FliH